MTEFDLTSSEVTCPGADNGNNQSTAVLSAESSSDMPMVDIFLNKTNRDDVQKMQEVMRSQMRSEFPIEDISKNFSSLFNLLWNSNLPCFSKNDTPGSDHLLKKCILHGQEVDCSSLFKPVPTDMGICCSFNHKNVLRDSEFLQLLKGKQMKNIQPERIGDDMKLAEIGVKRGLQVFVDQHSNRVTAGSISSPSKYNVKLNIHLFEANFTISVSSRFLLEPLLTLPTASAPLRWWFLLDTSTTS